MNTKLTINNEKKSSVSFKRKHSADNNMRRTNRKEDVERRSKRLKKFDTNFEGEDDDDVCQIDSHCQRCQNCQAPISGLLGESFGSHYQECLTIIKPIKECSKGIFCDSKLLNHYRVFAHLGLKKFIADLNSHRLIEINSNSEEELEKEVEKKFIATAAPSCVRKTETSELSIENTCKSLTLNDPLIKLNDLQTKEVLTEVICEPEINSIRDSFILNDQNELNQDLIDANSFSDLFRDVAKNTRDHLEQIETASSATCDEKMNHYVEILEKSTVFKSIDKIENIDFKNELKGVNESINLSLIDNDDLKLEKIGLDAESECKKVPVSFSPKKQLSITSFFGVGNSKCRQFIDDDKLTKKSNKINKLQAIKILEKTSATEKKNKPLRANLKQSSEALSTSEYKCPFYKKIPGTSFCVDAFSYGNIPGINHYFLSHFHYDHYRGLSKRFNQTIYSSHVTAQLVRLKIGIPESQLKCFNLNEANMIDGVRVTLLEANHCPGSVMFLFVFQNGRNILHTGDFRAHSSMKEYLPLQRNKIDQLYLDTTYLNDVYTFPAQKSVIDFVLQITKNALKVEPKTLIVCGSYTIGKERVFLAIAEALKLKIWANKEKRRIFHCLGDTFLTESLTENPARGIIHILTMKQLTFQDLSSHLKSHCKTFNCILAIKPTGWEYQTGSNLGNIKPKQRGNITIYGIPYSEHSSFNELEMFVKFLKPSKVIPTVNVGNPQKRALMNGILKKWTQT